VIEVTPGTHAHTHTKRNNGIYIRFSTMPNKYELQIPIPFSCRIQLISNLVWNVRQINDDVICSLIGSIGLRNTRAFSKCPT
jgi:hypothetical protein